MKLRKGAKKLLAAIVLLVTLSAILVSPKIALASILPALILLIPVFPVRVEIELSAPEFSRVGEKIEIAARLRIVGFGLVKVMHEIPETFKIVEGVNVSACFVAGITTVETNYSCIPLKRGVYSFGRFVVEVENLSATSSEVRLIETGREIEIKSRIYRVKKVEMKRSVAKTPIPEMDISRTGSPSTDFREIRKYTFGDPLRFVNWKATARMGELMVNDFEREGRKAVWIFVDAGRYMRHGTVLRNCYDIASETAISLCYFFAVRGYKVGVYVLGHSAIIYPESGRRQFRKVLSTLSRLDVCDSVESFTNAVERARRYMEIFKPASIFITRVERARDLRKAVLKAMKLGMRHRNLPVTVITVKGVEDGSIASLITEITRKREIGRIRKIGAEIMEISDVKGITQVIPVR